MRRRLTVIVVSCFFVLWPNVAHAATTVRVSVATAGTQGDDGSFDPSISATGRYVAFWSHATNFITEMDNGFTDIFRYDRETGELRAVSRDLGGSFTDGNSFEPSIDAKGRFVAFGSEASDIRSEDTNGVSDVFVRDLDGPGYGSRVSVSSSGAQANSSSFSPSIDAKGRNVAFASLATNLDGTESTAFRDIFVRDVKKGITTGVSRAVGGGTSNESSFSPAISGKGKFVAFASDATDLEFDVDTNVFRDVYVRDLKKGVTSRVSVPEDAMALADGDSAAPSIDAKGRFVAFESEATNLVGDDGDAFKDVFVFDRKLGTTTRVSTSFGGGDSNGDSGAPSIDAKGRFVAFESTASNLIFPLDSNGDKDVFVRDMETGFTTRVSRNESGGQADGDSGAPAIQGKVKDFPIVAFESLSSDLIALLDTNNKSDVFVRTFP